MESDSLIFLKVLEVTLRRRGTGAGALMFRRLAAELSSALSARHNGKGPLNPPPSLIPIPSDPQNTAQPAQWHR